MNFNDTKTAFQTKSNGDLRNALFLFTLIKYPAVVKLFAWLTKVALSIHFPMGWIIKPTLYRQFVGGEKLEECTDSVALLHKYGVQSVLDFSAEGGESQKDIDRAFNEVMHSIKFAQNRDAIPYAVFKPTAMGNVKMLTKASMEGVESLSNSEQELLAQFKERVFALCSEAHKLGVRILIDAEHYRSQEIIDRVVEEAMERFNSQKAIVFQTLQMYRVDRLDYLKRIYKDSLEKGYKLGVKFVRGAYMEEERDLAAKGGYPDPIFPTKEGTDNSYDAALQFVIEHIESIELFSGTHNYNSNYLLANLIEEHNLDKNDNRIFFSQLYGMSDNISFKLAETGFNVCKYLPYAPVKEVLPYLLRRAEENTSMSGQTGRELQLIKTEIKRRRVKER